jgi:galactonate dehydratase
VKVTDIKVDVLGMDFRNAVMVRVETDAGITGWAETLLKRHSGVIAEAILAVKDYLVGLDPTEIENHWEKMYRDSFWVGGPMHSAWISAIDCALWDVLAKSLGVPVYKLLGGPTRNRVPVYCHCQAGASPEAFAANVKRCKEDGYRAVKTTLPLFYGAEDRTATGAEYSGTNGQIDRGYRETEYLDPSVWPRIGEFFVAAREAGGEQMGLALDCHGRLNLKNARRLCRVLEDLELMWIEEPVPPENATVLAELKRETSIPIAAGERWATIHGVREFLEKQAVDILQCDLVVCGGVTGLKKIAALAEAQYVGMAPHNPNGPLATVLNVQFAATIPNFVILETIGSPADHHAAQKLLRTPLRVEDSHFPVPTGPGWGTEVNPEAFPEFPCLPEAGRR